MALGDWLLPDAPTDRDRLRIDLAEAEQRLVALESASSLAWLQGAPDPAAGKDGDVAIDLENGNLYLRDAGTWRLHGAFWLDVG